MDEKNTLGIYIHVPFCLRKCRYCDFYSVGYSKKLLELYVRAVVRNLKHYSDKSRVTDTVYFGGGTPSLLTPLQIAEIVSNIKKYYNLSDSPEITLEVNPDTVNPQKLENFLKAGVNRISIGVQSLIAEELEFLGRTHSPEKAVKAVLDAYSAGFVNISCDIIIALPNQTAEKLRYSAEKICRLPIKHISAYILKVEENTPFFSENIQDILPDDDVTASFYTDMVDIFSSNGFSQYEISNFSKNGFESRHNCRYWKCLDYIGIGPSAHSCLDGKRFAVKPDIREFVENPVQNVYITDENPCTFEEIAMLRLRLAEGLCLDDFPGHRDGILKKIPPYIREGFVELKNNTVSLTPKGFLVSNELISRIIF